MMAKGDERFQERAADEQLAGRVLGLKDKEQAALSGFLKGLQAGKEIYEVEKKPAANQ